MSTLSRETLSAMTLARVSYYHVPAMRQLCLEAGSFAAVIDNADQLQDLTPEARRMLASMLRDRESVERRVEEEAAFAEAHGIKVLTFMDDDYPRRLAECSDAPIVLFYRGTADLNAKRVVNIIGTRHATQYADDCIRRLVDELHQMCPDILVVSGLAYGVDIMAHRHSLSCGVPTVGVLAHGLDTLYPSAHRDDARRMMTNGGLLTEHFTHTNADKVNFVRRNRIVAGMADATILVESAERGGGLITCRMANSYGRDVFAYPGRVGDAYSAGCNNLIRQNGARLFTSAADIVEAMEWGKDTECAEVKKKGIERSLFPQLDAESKKIVDALTANNDQHLNVLATTTSIPIGSLKGKLFELEMQGIVKALAGSIYHLIK